MNLINELNKINTQTHKNKKCMVSLPLTFSIKKGFYFFLQLSYILDIVPPPLFFKFCIIS